VSTHHHGWTIILQEKPIGKVQVSLPAPPLFLKARADKRPRYVVLTGGTLVTFKIKPKQAFQHRARRISLFGAYVYSGLLASNEIRLQADRDALFPHVRSYADGLEVSWKSPCSVTRLIAECRWI
jgi:hypothetical protein